MITKLPWKVSGYRPFGIISRDPNESTYEKGDDKFSQFIHFTGSFETMKDNSAYVVKACNMYPELLKIRDHINVLNQALLEVRHALNSGQEWYTRGASGLYGQVSMWVDRGFSAYKEIDTILSKVGEE